MALVNITFCRPAQFEGFGLIGDIVTSENITSSGTSQASTNSALSGTCARVAVSGGDVHVTTATAPTATTSHMLLVDGSVEYIFCPYGHKVAVIDAA